MTSNSQPAAEEKAKAAERVPSAASGKREYTLEQKRFLVRRRLEEQPAFNNKIHKNELLWDKLYQQFMEEYPDQRFRKKESVRDQFDKEQKKFRDWSKKNAAFRAGKVSGMSTDRQQQELYKVTGVTHDFFPRVQAR